ncbi:hypothetical protein NP233_g6861 [Leucocoprinus birnbaumii]|uniref:Nucleotidyltransferase n=1 Tax=Leucocoprinus birnbaumii TaxID=56174 RepID=A0AAD5YV58_9AGAR|nr:hypothetical protein NP233_g6861 [Leucocoprinus birnbaumii]
MLPEHDNRRTYRPNSQEIQRTARAIVQVLAEHSFHCCLFGSTAAAMYGAENRNPRHERQDVDVIVLVPPASPAAAEITVEEIKFLISTNSSSDFYLTPSQDPIATHTILHYVLTPFHPHPEDPQHHACKVDLLLPGTIGIPKHIPTDVIHYEDYFPDIPLLPFGALILLKVRAWNERHVDTKLRKSVMEKKIKTDEEDLRELLDLAVNHYMVRLRKIEMWTGWEWVDQHRDIVRKFAKKFPGTRRDWEEIGIVLKSEWSMAPSESSSRASRVRR